MRLRDKKGAYKGQLYQPFVSLRRIGKEIRIQGKAKTSGEGIHSSSPLRKHASLRKRDPHTREGKKKTAVCAPFILSGAKLRIQGPTLFPSSSAHRQKLAEPSPSAHRIHSHPSSAHTALGFSSSSFLFFSKYEEEFNNV